MESNNLNLLTNHVFFYSLGFINYVTGTTGMPLLYQLLNEVSYNS